MDVFEQALLADGALGAAVPLRAKEAVWHIVPHTVCAEAKHHLLVRGWEGSWKGSGWGSGGGKGRGGGHGHTHAHSHSHGHGHGELAELGEGNRVGGVQGGGASAGSAEGARVGGAVMVHGAPAGTAGKAVAGQRVVDSPLGAAGAEARVGALPRTVEFL